MPRQIMSFNTCHLFDRFYFIFNSLKGLNSLVNAEGF